MACLVLILSILNETSHIIHQAVIERSTLTYECNFVPLPVNSSINSFRETKTEPVKCALAEKSYWRNTTISSKPTLNSSLDSSSVFCQQIGCNQETNCASNLTEVYLYSRVITLILRDVMFVLTFVVSNILIYRVLQDEEHQQFLSQNNKLNPQKTLKMILALAVVFSMLVLPKDIFVIVYYISYLTGNPMNNSIGLEINSVLKLLQSLNSIVNIFIYAKLHTTFKESVSVTMEDLSFKLRSKNQKKNEEHIPLSD